MYLYQKYHVFLSKNSVSAFNDNTDFWALNIKNQDRQYRKGKYFKHVLEYNLKAEKN